MAEVTREQVELKAVRPEAARLFNGNGLKKNKNEKSNTHTHTLCGRVEGKPKENQKAVRPFQLCAQVRVARFQGRPLTKQVFFLSPTTQLFFFFFFFFFV